MRPTVQEQLQGTCRILENVVAPCIGDPFARTILDGLVANLRMLSGAVPALTGFQRHDNQATLRLLSTLRDALAPALAARIDQALSVAEPDVADAQAQDERNRLLRELLATSVCSEDLTPDMHRAIVQHMAERASRMPMRYVPTAPAPATTAKP